MIEIWEKIIYIPENINDLEDLQYIYNREYFNFEGAKLAVDGTLIRKQINYNEGATYFDRKGNYSINAMYVFDSRCNIRNIYINKPGSTNDKRVFGESWLSENIESVLPGDNFMLGDGGYTLSRKVLIPYNSIQLSSDPSGIKSNYNKIQSSARMCAERGIGRLKQRFKKLMNGINIYKAKNCVKFITSASIFHQLLLNIEDGYTDSPILDEEQTEYQDNENITLNRNTYRDATAERLYLKHRRIITINI